MAESQFNISAVLSVGESNASFATWNISTALNSTAQLVNKDFSYNTIVVTLNQTVSLLGGAVTFQGSLDGVNWFNLVGFSPVTQTAIGPIYSLSASTYAVFSFNLTAIPYFQVLLSTVISGVGSLTIGYAADSFVNSSMSSGGSGSNASVGPNGSPIPSDSTLIGSKDVSGNLQPASAANPIPVTSVIAGTGEAPTNVSVGLTSTAIVATNSLRKGLNLCNISFGTISISFGSNAAVLYSGITLGPGGTFWMDATDFTIAAVNAISTQVNTLLAVQEFE